jgi:hypothetical protein
MSKGRSNLISCAAFPEKSGDRASSARVPGEIEAAAVAAKARPRHPVAQDNKGALGAVAEEGYSKTLTETGHFCFKPCFSVLAIA